MQWRKELRVEYESFPGQTMLAAVPSITRATGCPSESNTTRQCREREITKWQSTRYINPICTHLKEVDKLFLVGVRGCLPRRNKIYLAFLLKVKQETEFRVGKLINESNFRLWSPPLLHRPFSSRSPVFFASKTKLLFLLTARQTVFQN